jgi:putative SOS response-associated peptidase YedK
MCGRFTLATEKKEIEEHFPLFDVPDLTPRFNIAPTQEVAAARILPDGPKREVALLRWGLVPSWADDLSIGNRLINARAETVAEKPSFRSAYKKRRCLIVTDGFYEWQKTEGKKQPYCFKLKDGGPFAFAGLWEHWEREGNVVETCTILTTQANEVLKPVHDRMPVIVARADYERWLDPGNQTAAGLDVLLRPFPAELMMAYPVSTVVNSPRHDLPDCMVPLTVPTALF